MARSVAFRKSFRFILPSVSRAARASRTPPRSRSPDPIGGYHYMHVTRCLALFLGIVFSLPAAAAVKSVGPVDEGLEQTFKYTNPDAKTVSVAGEFNNWGELPMTKDDSGTWSRTVHLKPGYYAYKLVVNGEWILDPANPARKTVNDMEDSAVS